MSELEKQSAKIIKKIDRLLFVNKNKVDIRDTIIIVGTPRSGSTWFMEILSSIPNYTYIFEPLNPTYSPDSFKAGFYSRTYLPPNKEWAEGEEYLKKVFTAQAFGFIRPYEYKMEVIMNRILAKKLIVKFIRLTRLLPWVESRFQLRGIFYLIRHPCSVIASQLKTNVFGYHPINPPYSGIFPNLKQVVDEAKKIDFLEEPLIKRLQKIKTREEILAAVWCLDNLVPLTSPKPHKWTSVIYEKMVDDGRNEIKRVFNSINEKIPDSAYKHLREPSMLTMKKDRKTIEDSNIQLSKWKKSLSKKQIENILSIVSDFGLDFYTNDIIPNYKILNSKI